jgi:phospho-N-acetylmuramoyl-pentapeptide-transferase
MIIDVVKVITPAIISFLIGLAITPPIADYLYRNKMWKKRTRTVTTDGREAKIFAQLHQNKEVGTPRMGGIVIWGAVLLTTILFYLLPIVFTESGLDKINFFSRNQTWLTVFTLIVGALIGLVDDWWVCKKDDGYFAGGISLKARIILIGLVGVIGGWWFYYKLGVSSIHIPFDGDISLGLLFIPFFILVMLATYSGGVIDGLDGLSGGVFAAIFSGYAIIAFFANQINLAAFCAVVVGGTLAFLWFNIPPARFYNTETGIMALTTTLTVVAFLTGEVLVLPIIAFPLVLASASTSLQLISKKFRNGRKMFLVAPIHHHFEAIGWPSYKVTMRFWIISIVSALTGTIIALIG